MPRGRRKTPPAVPTNRVYEYRLRTRKPDGSGYLTQADLAKAAGFHDSTAIYKIENGITKKLSWENAAAIARAITAAGVPCEPSDLYLGNPPARMTPPPANQSDPAVADILLALGRMSPEQREHFRAIANAVAPPPGPSEVTAGRPGKRNSA